MEVSVSGYIEGKVVSLAAVQRRLDAEDRYNLYLTLAVGAGGALASTAATLGAQAVHPIPIYLVIVAEAVVGALMTTLTIAESVQRKSAREALSAEAGAAITYQIHGGSTFMSSLAHTGDPNP